MQGARVLHRFAPRCTTYHSVGDTLFGGYVPHVTHHYHAIKGSRNIWQVTNGLIEDVPGPQESQRIHIEHMHCASRAAYVASCRRGTNEHCYGNYERRKVLTFLSVPAFMYDGVWVSNPSKVSCECHLDLALKELTWCS